MRSGCLPFTRTRRAPASSLQLERAATAGVGLVLFLAAAIVWQAVAAGMPAIASGELPLLRPAVTSNLPESLGVLSFA